MAADASKGRVSVAFGAEKYTLASKSSDTFLQQAR
jgi:hypothetical protein